jgi:hypothetical protein
MNIYLRQIKSSANVYIEHCKITRRWSEVLNMSYNHSIHIEIYARELLPSD